MFSLKLSKSLMVASAVSFITSLGLATSSAQAVTCPGVPPISGVDRYLEISTDPGSNVSSISCLASGTESTADAAFQSAFTEYTFVGKEEDKPLSGNEGIGALDGILDEVSGSFWDGLEGEFTFTEPATPSPFYAILFKFGKPALSESWFAIRVAGGFDPFNILWRSIDSDGNLRTGQALSHVTLYAAPVPVPAAGILLLTALGGIGFAARRRRKAN